MIFESSLTCENKKKFYGFRCQKIISKSSRLRIIKNTPSYIQYPFVCHVKNRLHNFILFYFMIRNKRIHPTDANFVFKINCVVLEGTNEFIITPVHI
jgi:hypothetical protein